MLCQRDDSFAASAVCVSRALAAPPQALQLADAREAAAKAAAVDQAAGDDAEVAEHDKAWAGMKPESQKAAVVLGWLNEAMCDNHEHVRQSHSTHSHTPHSLASPLAPTVPLSRARTAEPPRPPCRSSAHCRAPSLRPSRQAQLA